MKKIAKCIVVLSILVLSSLTLRAQLIPKDSLYLGQKPPGNTPKLFKLPVTENFFAQERIAISNDGKEIYYQELDGYSELDGKPHTARIKQFSFSNGKWNQSPLTMFENVGSPGLSLSGDTMYLEKNIKEGYYSVKTNKGWSAPKRFLTKLKIAHYLQVTNSGNYYISSYPADNIGGIDRSRLIIKGSDTTITSLGLPVNTGQHDLDYFVSRDESYMVVVAADNTLGISYHKKDGSWTNPKSLGKSINFGIAAWGPYVTADNKYLFYTTATQQDFSDLGIYWIAINDLIESLKGTNFIPYLKNKISDQTTKVGQLFNYTIPENTFIDDDGSNTLTYSAALIDDSPLPSWLSFDPAARTFSGTSTSALTISVKVTATDKANESVFSTFTITAVNPNGTANSGMASGKSYFGQALPGETPLLFAPEILNSVSKWVAATEYSPDGTQFFLAVGDASYTGGKLYYSKCVDNVWTPFVQAPFTADFIYSHEPVFSADGSSFTFTGKKTEGTLDLWTVTYSDNKWGKPIALPSPINSNANEFRGSRLPNGVFYFTSERSGMYQVYKGVKDAAQKMVVELVGAPISTKSYEGDPCIAPDGHFLIFNSVRASGHGGSDLYVSFSDGQGGWKTPINLGPKFNSPTDEYGAHLSSDGKYLFFTRHSANESSIFWVAISAIEKLK